MNIIFWNEKRTKPQFILQLDQILAMRDPKLEHLENNKLRGQKPPKREKIAKISIDITREVDSGLDYHLEIKNYAESSDNGHGARHPHFTFWKTSPKSEYSSENLAACKSNCQFQKVSLKPHRDRAAPGPGPDLRKKSDSPGEDPWHIHPDRMPRLGADRIEQFGMGKETQSGSEDAAKKGGIVREALEGGGRRVRDPKGKFRRRGCFLNWPRD